MITDDELRQIMPNCAQAKRALYLPHLQAAMAEFGITSRLREAAFLAQLAHESGEFRFMEEIWGPTSAQRRYEPPSDLARRLGNTQPGDGKRFKGRGPIQLTGRANYQSFGNQLGVDLVNNPEQAATPEVAFRIAGLYWKSRGLNELADAQNFREITRRINGGFNGLDDRTKYYNRALGVLNDDQTRSLPVAGEERDVPANLSRGILPGELEEEFGITPTKAPARKSAKKSAKKAAKKSAASRGASSGASAKAGKKSASKKGGGGKGASKKGGGGSRGGGGSKKGGGGKGGSSRGGSKKGGGGSRGGGSKKGGAKKGGGSKKGAGKGRR